MQGRRIDRRSELTAFGVVVSLLVRHLLWLTRTAGQVAYHRNRTRYQPWIEHTAS
jgi:hypothetical protein